MGISIYYSFKVAKNLKSSGFLKDVEDEWSALFDGAPYESWTWYEPEVFNKKTFGSNTYKYEGATGLLLSEDSGPESLVKALELLTKVRNNVGGEDWVVNLDDMEMPWIDNCYSIEL